MQKYVIVYEYDDKAFMDLKRIITFKQNLEKIVKNNIQINFIFVGNASNEEFATLMSYFNSLVKHKICTYSISLKNHELITESGLNNKIIKLSSQKSRNLKLSNLDYLIKGIYGDENIILKTMPIKDWETTILDLIEN